MTTDTVTKPKNKVKCNLAPPKNWKVVVFDDDTTPMQLVIEIIMVIFNHEEEDAVNLTLEVHNTGSAVVGTYSHEIAEHKSLEAMTISRTNGYQLVVAAEEE